MFQKGNKLSVGRPRISLTKPELLLPVVFGNANINWARDFTVLYRKMRDQLLNEHEKAHLKFLMELMPYLCTKVQLKEIEDKMPKSTEQSVKDSKQTMDLLKALENESPSQSKGS